MKKLTVLLSILVCASVWAQTSQPGPGSPYKVMSIGHYKLSRSIGYNDVWGWTSPAGREYALLGVQDGTSVVDVTDAPKMKEVSFIASSRSTWKDIKTYQNYAYVVNESSGGMQILDLSGLPEKVELVATYSGFSTSHNLYIDEVKGILFAEGNHSQPVRIFSLENPIAPKQLSSLGVECHDMWGQDGLLYVSEGGHGTIGVFNYDDPKNPRLIKRFQIPRSGYVHNAWGTEDGRFILTTEENTNKTMKMWDVSNLDDVQMVDEIIADNKLAHNAHIKGDYAYVSHYGSGLQILNISNPSKMKIEAYFMKHDNAPTRGFVDVWGAYPFFKSGKVLVSDIKDGLYVVPFAGAKE